MSSPFQNYCPRSGKMANALYIVKSGAPVSKNVFDVVFECAKKPENMFALCDPDLVPACMRILKQCHEEVYEDGEKGSVIDSENGVACLRLLSFVIQMGFIINKHGVLASADPSTLDPSFSFTDSVLAKLRLQVESSEEFIWRTDMAFPRPMSWMSVAQAAALLEYLFAARTDFLRERLAEPRLWSGFSVLLYGIWAHMRGPGGIHPATMGSKLFDISCRFVLAQSSQDEECLTKSMIHITKNLIAAATGGLETHATNLLDEQVVVKTYIIRAYIGLELNLSTSLMEWAYRFVTHRLPGLVAPFFAASFDRMWKALDEDVELTVHRICDVVECATQLIAYAGMTLENDRMGQKPKGELIDLIVKNDIFGLFARVTWLNLASGKFDMNARDKRTLIRFYDDLNDQITEFVQTLYTYCKSNLSVFKKATVDWAKASDHLHELCRTLDDHEFVQAHISKCDAAWTSFGRSLLFEKRGEACTYPRCAYPEAGSKAEHGPCILRIV